MKREKMNERVAEPITAKEFELVTSSWDPEKWVRFCNILIASYAEGLKSQIQLTERIYVQDRGVDAELFVHDPHLKEETLGLVGPGRTVYQFKQRNAIRPDKSRVIDSLKVAEETRKLVRDQNVPDRYVLLTNVQLKAAQQKSLQNKIESGFAPQSKVKVHVLGGAELTALVLNRPHLQQIFFVRGPFYSYEEARQMHIRVSGTEELSPFVGREDILKDLTASLADPQCRVIVLHGPPEIGKSRLCLEVLKLEVWRARSAWASDPLQVSAEDLRRLEPPKNVVFVVLENLDELRAEELARHASIRDHLKLILTLRRPLFPEAPSWVRQFKVEHLEDREIERLIRETSKSLGYNRSLWLKEFSKGIPGILLQTIAASPDLDESLGDLRTRIGESLARRLTSNLTPDQLKHLRILSLLPQVGVEGNYRDELVGLCNAAGVSCGDILAELADFEREDLLIRRGSFVEVIPSLLANHLALTVLSDRQEVLDNLFALLPPRGRLALARRLSEIDGQKVQAFLRDILGPQGVFKNVSDIGTNPRLLNELADPSAVLECLIRLIKENLGPEERKEQIAGDLRSRVVFALEDLLGFKETFSGAVELLFLLAEAEPKDNIFSSREGSILGEVFHWNSLQIPVSLDERLDLLNDLANRYPKSHLIIIHAVKQAFSRFIVRVRQGCAARPYDREWRPSHEEISRYAEGILSLLKSFAQDDAAPDTAREACKAIAEIVKVTEIFFWAKDSAFEALDFLVQEARQLNPAIDVTTVISAIEWLEKDLADREQREKTTDPGLLEDLARRWEALRTNTFEAEMKRWAGRLSYQDEEIAEEGLLEQREDPVQGALTELATRAGEELTPALLDWLTSEDAENAFHFFKALGTHDQAKQWLLDIEQRSSRPRGSVAFGAYCAGWLDRAETEVFAYFDAAIQRSDIAPEVILQAIFVAEKRATPESVKRLVSLLKNRKVPPESVAQGARLGGWLRDLPPNSFKVLVKNLMKASEEGGGTAHLSLIDLMLMWNHLHKEKGWTEDLQELGWQLLDSTPLEGNIQEIHRWDRLADVLSTQEPDRGLRLLEKTLRKGPIAVAMRLLGHPRRPLFSTLSKWNRQELLRTLLRASLESDEIAFRISFSMHEEFDPQNDQDRLLNLASQENAQGARVLAGWLNTGKKGFWPLAGELIKLYPNDDELKGNLSSQALPTTGVIVGSLAPVYEERAREARKLAEGTSSPIVRSWARKLARQLSEAAGHEVVWDYDHNIDDLRRFVENKESPERLWAIGRILQRAPFEEARKLLSIEDIREALPKIELPGKKRKALETALRYWDSER